jgi:redox-sensing transcriptional repressor
LDGFCCPSTARGGIILQSKTPKISEAVVRRLPIYLRYLLYLQEMNIQTVSSHELGQKLDMNPAQIRKDLAYFGEFGRKGIGYEVDYLIDKIKQILKLDRTIRVAVVGAGHLGIALSNYNRYLKDNLSISAIFDIDPEKIGKKIGPMEVYHLDRLKEVVESLKIEMAIVTVPASEAQKVVDRLVEAGVKTILNFAPEKLKVPPGVFLRNADLTTELQSLAYYL